MATNIIKLDRFYGGHFLRWQKRVHFLLTSLHLVYVISTPKPDESENETIDQLRKRKKWETDDYTCRGHILNAMEDSLFDLYYNVKSAKELWEKLETRYMKEDATYKKFLVSNFNTFKMVDERPVMEQFWELERILNILLNIIYTRMKLLLYPLLLINYHLLGKSLNVL